MKLDKALIILEQYNKWRRDNSFPLPNKYEMPDLKQIGMAIDLILEYHKKRNINENATIPRLDNKTI